jgi:hypothetical protein
VQDIYEIGQTKEAGNQCLIDTPGIVEKDNPRSLINIAPTGVAKLLEELDSSWIEMSEKQLKQHVPDDPQLNRLRIAFWKEYDAAQSQLRPMMWAHNSAMLAYILCPPVSYDVFLEEALSFGMTRIREILNLPLHDENGKVNAKVGELILKAAAFLDLRTHGGFLQKSVHAEVGMGVGSIKKLADQLSIEEINKKIAELESTGVVDVTPVEPE